MWKLVITVVSMSLVGIVGFALPSAAQEIGSPGLEQGALPMRLPELGSKRRVVMSEMRRAGYALLESDGDRLVFAGSPAGWPRATTITYVFRFLVAEEVRLDYIDLQSAKATSRIYANAKRRLSTWFGAPWLDRMAPPSESEQPQKSTWEDQALYAELVTKHEPLHSVAVAIKRSAHLKAKQEVEAVKGDDMPFGAAEAFRGLSTSAKEAAEILFDDFSEMDLILESARDSGKPVRVRLGEVKLPAGLDGVDEALIQRRFSQVTSGNWNLETSTTRRDTDIELRVALTESMVAGKRVYSMKLDAFAQDGKPLPRRKANSKRVYSARHRLE